jgi:hypothetical protein
LPSDFGIFPVPCKFALPKKEFEGEVVPIIIGKHRFDKVIWRGSSVGESAGFITLRSGVQFPLSLHKKAVERLLFLF